MRWMLLLAVLLSLLDMVSLLGITGIQKWLIDDVFVDGQYDRLYPYLGIFAALIIGYNAVHLFSFLLNRSNEFALQKKLDDRSYALHVPDEGVQICKRPHRQHRAKVLRGYRGNGLADRPLSPWRHREHRASYRIVGMDRMGEPLYAAGYLFRKHRVHPCGQTSCTSAEGHTQGGAGSEG